MGNVVSCTAVVCRRAFGVKVLTRGGPLRCGERHQSERGVAVKERTLSEGGRRTDAAAKSAP